MSLHDITVGMLVALPWALVVVVVVGSGTAALRRWIERCRWCKS
jgi:hypothetical protein